MKKTNEVFINGIKLNGAFPVEGNECWAGLGKDKHYRRFQIGTVFKEDGSEFEVLNKDGSHCGIAVLATSKNHLYLKPFSGNYYLRYHGDKPEYYYFTCGDKPFDPKH